MTSLGFSARTCILQKINTRRKVANDVNRLVFMQKEMVLISYEKVTELYYVLFICEIESNFWKCSWHCDFGWKVFCVGVVRKCQIQHGGCHFLCIIFQQNIHACNVASVTSVSLTCIKCFFRRINDWNKKTSFEKKWKRNAIEPLSVIWINWSRLISRLKSRFQILICYWLWLCLAA